MDRYTAGQIANHDFGEFITLDETFVRSEDVAELEEGIRAAIKTPITDKQDEAYLKSQLSKLLEKE